MVEDMVNDVFDLVEGEERRKYAQAHGINSLINMFHGLPWNDEESERVYRICNEREITWEEYYGIDKNRNVIY